MEEELRKDRTRYIEQRMLKIDEIELLEKQIESLEKQIKEGRRIVDHLSGAIQAIDHSLTPKEET